jgi:hypothetical protein
LSDGNAEFGRSASRRRPSRRRRWIGDCSKPSIVRGRLEEVDHIIAQFQIGTSIVLLEQFAPFALLEKSLALAFGVIVGHGNVKNFSVQRDRWSCRK